VTRSGEAGSAFCAGESAQAVRDVERVPNVTVVAKGTTDGKIASLGSLRAGAATQTARKIPS